MKIGHWIFLRALHSYDVKVPSEQFKSAISKLTDQMHISPFSYTQALDRLGLKEEDNGRRDLTPYTDLPTSDARQLFHRLACEMGGEGQIDSMKLDGGQLGPFFHALKAFRIVKNEPPPIATKGRPGMVRSVNKLPPERNLHPEYPSLGDLLGLDESPTSHPVVEPNDEARDQIASPAGGPRLTPVEEDLRSAVDQTSVTMFFDAFTTCIATLINPNGKYHVLEPTRKMFTCAPKAGN